MMKMSRREVEMLPMIGRGMTYQQIADDLDLSRKTVITYANDFAARIRSDLPAKSRIQIYYRMKNGLSIFTGEPLSLNDGDDEKSG